MLDQLIHSVEISDGLAVEAGVRSFMDWVLFFGGLITGFYWSVFGTYAFENLIFT